MLKTSIRHRLMVYYIILTVTILIVTVAGIRIITDIYIKNQTMTELDKAMENIDEDMVSHILQSTDSGDYYSVWLWKNLNDFNTKLNENSTLLDINFVILDKNMTTIIYPLNPGDKQKKVLEDIFPYLKFTGNNADKERSFIVNDIKYIAMARTLNSNPQGMLIVYSGMSRADDLSIMINYLIFPTFILGLLIAVAMSGYVSKLISHPIEQLCTYVNKIGGREFKASVPQTDNDEIGMLATSIKQMALKLENHDYTMRSFFQNASHEIRTPLMSIQGYAEGIEQGVFDDNTEAAKIITAESKRLNHIVGDLMYLSRVEGIEASFDAQLLRICEVIYEAVSRVKPLSVLSNIEILDFTSDSSLTVKGDMEMLVKAIENVISNCIRFAKTKVVISVDNDANYRYIIIKDDGDGIDPYDLPHIFERFYKGKKGKTGLGLSIAKAIAERHGGDLFACNENGAMFIFRYK